MSKKLITSVVAGLALLATPVLAQSGMAERAAAALSQAEGVGEDGDEFGEGWLLAAGAITLIVGAVTVALSNDEEDLPVSP